MRKFIIGLILFFFVAAPVSASQSSFLLSSPNTSIAVGSSFTVKITASSGDTSVNTIAANINFDPNYLQALTLGGPSVITISISKNIVGNNSATFEGGIIPAQILTNDRVGTITFKAIKEGDTNISIDTSSDIYADDGQGTTLNPSRGNLPIKISPAPKIIPSTEPILEPINTIDKPTTETTELPKEETQTINQAPKTDVVTPKPQLSCFEIWWENYKDLVSIVAATALLVFGAYLSIKSLLTLFRKKKR